MITLGVRGAAESGATLSIGHNVLLSFITRIYLSEEKRRQSTIIFFLKRYFFASRALRKGKLISTKRKLTQDEKPLSTIICSYSKLT